MTNAEIVVLDINIGVSDRANIAGGRYFENMYRAYKIDMACLRFANRKLIVTTHAERLSFSIYITIHVDAR